MLQSNIVQLWATMAFAATAPLILSNEASTDSVSVQITPVKEQPYQSGPFMRFYPHSLTEYMRSNSDSERIDCVMAAMQDRYQALKGNFMRYSDGFPEEKASYFIQMANVLCRLDFKDSLTSYNKSDASIDSVLKLRSGLTLSVSKFIEDDPEAPVVFSIHRGHDLLVSDELPVDEIVNIIKSVIA